MLSNTNERSLRFHIFKYKLSNTNERYLELLKMKGQIDQYEL